MYHVPAMLNSLSLNELNEFLVLWLDSIAHSHIAMYDAVHNKNPQPIFYDFHIFSMWSKKKYFFLRIYRVTGTAKLASMKTKSIQSVCDRKLGESIETFIDYYR